MPDLGVDAEKLDVLRRWGSGLENDARAEVSAAGRAILLLIDEVERLHVLVWDRQLYPDDPVAAPPEAPAADARPDASSRLFETLRSRLRKGSANSPFPHAEPASEEGIHR